MSASEPHAELSNLRPHLTGVRNIYVSGPMTGLPEFNYPAFREATASLRDAGFDVYCPTERLAETGERLDTTGMNGTERLPNTQFNLRAAFADYSAYITQTADAVAVLSGWENSNGALAEVMLAKAFGLPILDAYTLERIDFDTTVETAANSEPDPIEEAMARHPAGKRRQPLKVVEPASDGEVRTTSATGGQKGVKEARFDLIPPGPLWELAVLYGRGAMKYDPNNWKRGYDWSLSKGALERHFGRFWMGEDHDREMGVKHLIAVAWHAFNLAWMMENRPEFDDRPTIGEKYDGALPTPQWLLDAQAKRAAEGE